MPNEKNQLKIILQRFLNEKDYENFIIEITKLELTDENYIMYLGLIEDVLSERMLKEDIINVSSGEKLLRTLGVIEKEKTFLEMLNDIKLAVIEIFSRKLKVRKSVTFSDDERNKKIKEELNNFEGRFM